MARIQFPGATSDKPKASDFAFYWHARYKTLDALTGQPWTFSQTAGTQEDLRGQNLQPSGLGYTVPSGLGLPPWHTRFVNGKPKTVLHIRGHDPAQGIHKLRYEWNLLQRGAWSIMARLYPRYTAGSDIGGIFGRTVWALGVGAGADGGVWRLLRAFGNWYLDIRRPPGLGGAYAISVPDPPMDYVLAPLDLLVNIALDGALTISTRRNDTGAINTSVPFPSNVLSGLPWNGKQLWAVSDPEDTAGVDTGGADNTGANVDLEFLKIARADLTFAQMDALAI